MILMVSVEPNSLARSLAALSRRLDRTLEAKSALMEQHGIALAEQVSELAPFDTGFMSEHVTFSPLKQGPYDFEVGWYQEDFDRAGHPPYYVYQELGTVMQEAQPSLGPASRALESDLQRDVTQMLKREMGAN